MLLIGSNAMKHWGILPEGRKIKDTDYICTFHEFKQWTKEHKDEIALCVPLSGDKFHVRDKQGWNYEFEIAWPGTAAEALLKDYDGYTVAPIEVLYALKMSHRYLKDSPHFLKTMRDIQYLRTKISLNERKLSESDWFKQREKETYVYNHPKLNQSKEGFFSGDGVRYVYDHDSIHEAVALIWTNHPMGLDHYPQPAYTFYMQDGAQVMTDKAKFFSVDEEIRLFGVYEESCVLALERSQIPFDFKPEARYSFELALMKVCTSITSGWFREYAWDNYDKVIDLYNRLGDNHYIERFNKNQQLLKPFNGSVY